MRSEKQLLLDDVRDRLEGSNTFLLARYQKLASQMATDFRASVRKTGGDFEVVRKRILLKAAKSVDLSFDEMSLEGHIGIVFVGEDALETTKAVVEFGKESDGLIEVVGGYFDGVVYGREEIERLSKLPSLPEMRAQLLGLLEAPMAQTLSVVQALLTSVVYCLDNKSKQGS